MLEIGFYHNLITVNRGFKMVLVSQEIRAGLKGEIEYFQDRGKFKIALVKRDCPYCLFRTEQPVMHLVIYYGTPSTCYICPDCWSHYYFVGDKVYQLVPEAQLLYLKNYLKIPSRIDTIKTYSSLYHKANDFKWFLNIDLNISDEIIEGTWTMPVEAAAQMYYKDKNGTAPGYSIGNELKILYEDPEAKDYVNIVLEMEQFVPALTFLKDKGLM